MQTMQSKIDAMYQWLDDLSDRAGVSNERDLETWIIEMALRVSPFCRQVELAAAETELQRDAENRRAKLKLVE